MENPTEMDDCRRRPILGTTTNHGLQNPKPQVVQALHLGIGSFRCRTEGIFVIPPILGWIHFSLSLGFLVNFTYFSMDIIGIF